MQRKFHFLVKDKATASADDTDNGGIRFKCGSQFSRKSVGSAFSCVLGKHASKVKKKELLGESGNGKAWHIKGKASSNELGNNLACGDEPVEAALSPLLALEETDEGKQNRKDRRRVKTNLPLLSFLDKKKGWNNFMGARFSSDVHGGNSNNVVTSFGQLRRKASLRHLVRIPSKLLVIPLKLKMIRSLIKKKATKQFEQGADDENEDRELCKKRILMGVRCRPLSSPGYDTNSFFLPRDSSFTRAQRHP